METYQDKANDGDKVLFFHVFGNVALEIFLLDIKKLIKLFSWLPMIVIDDHSTQIVDHVLKVD